MLLYAVTSRILLADTEQERAEKLVALASRWAADSVDYIQIRERDLPTAELLKLASKIVQAVRHSSSPTRVLINSNPVTALSVALESGAHGVHLSGGLSSEKLAGTIEQLRKDWRSPAALRPTPAISVSCHSAAEVRVARAAGASLALFAPVFEKALPGALALPGQGLESLTEACRAAHETEEQPTIAVIALGGVTLENAGQCIAAGADGIAAIRLFLDTETEPGWQRLSQAGRNG